MSEPENTKRPIWRRPPFFRRSQVTFVLLLALAGLWFAGREEPGSAAAPPALPASETPADPAARRAEAEAELAEGARLVEDRYPERAEPHLLRALALEPQSADVRYWLGKCAMGQGELDRAESELDAAMDLDPENARIVFGMAELIGAKLSATDNPLSQVGLATRGKRMIDRAIELDGSLVDARLARILYCLSAPSLLGGGIERAREEVEAIREVDEAVALFAEGWLAEQDGEWSRAEELHRRSIELNPDYPRVRHRLGYLLLGQNRCREALEEFEAYRRIEPRNPFANDGLGRSLAGLGRYAEARDRYREALSVRPDLVGTRFELADCLDRLGRPEAAAEEYRRALEGAGDENSSRVAVARAWLEEHAGG